MAQDYTRSSSYFFFFLEAAFPLPFWADLLPWAGVELAADFPPGADLLPWADILVPFVLPAVSLLPSGLAGYLSPPPSFFFPFPFPLPLSFPDEVSARAMMWALTNSSAVFLLSTTVTTSSAILPPLV